MASEHRLPPAIYGLAFFALKMTGNVKLKPSRTTGAGGLGTGSDRRNVKRGLIEGRLTRPARDGRGEHMSFLVDDEAH